MANPFLNGKITVTSVKKSDWFKRSEKKSDDMYFVSQHRSQWKYEGFCEL